MKIVGYLYFLLTCDLIRNLSYSLSNTTIVLCIYQNGGALDGENKHKNCEIEKNKRNNSTGIS